MSLFKDITDFKKYVKLNKDVDFDNALAPYEPDAARKYILKHLGKDLYAEIEEYYNTTPNTADAALDALLPYVQSALARFTLLLASPSLDINIGTTGYTTQSTTNMVAASGNRVDKLDKSLERLGWDAIESMLAFLEENKDDYDSWVSSPAYTMNITGLVNSAEDFNKEHDIDNSRLRFIFYRPAIKRVETLYIKPAISSELFNEIVEEIKEADISEANQTLLDLLRTAIVMFVMSETRNDSFQANAEAFLSEAKKLLDANEDDYPSYVSSSVYRGGADAQPEQFLNVAENKFFVAGAPFINSNK